MAAAFEAPAALATVEAAMPAERVATQLAASEPVPGPVRSLRTAHDVSGPRTRTGDVLLAEPADFESLLLSRPVLEGLRAAGFERPSPVQLKAIPLGRCGLGEGGGRARAGRVREEPRGGRRCRPRPAASSLSFLFCTTRRGVQWEDGYGLLHSDRWLSIREDER